MSWTLLNFNRVAAFIWERLDGRRSGRQEGNVYCSKDIAAKHFKTADEQKQRDMSAKRFEFRDFLGTSYYREVNLKPMP